MLWIGILWHGQLFGWKTLGDTQTNLRRQEPESYDFFNSKGEKPRDAQPLYIYLFNIRPRLLTVSVCPPQYILEARTGSNCREESYRSQTPFQVTDGRSNMYWLYMDKDPIEDTLFSMYTGYIYSLSWLHLFTPAPSSAVTVTPLRGWIASYCFLSSCWYSCSFWLATSFFFMAFSCILCASLIGPWCSA